MKTKILKTTQEYDDACARIYSLIHSSVNSIEPDSPEGEELELLTLLVEKYEHELYPSLAPDPIEAIKATSRKTHLK